jgi:hypothetical protein
MKQGKITVKKIHHKQAATLAVFGAMASVLCPLLEVRAAPPEPLSLLRAKAPDTGWQVTSTTPLTLAPETGFWDLSHHDSVYLKLRNSGTEQVVVWARAENPEAKGVMDNCRTALVLEPDKTDTLRLRLIRRPQDPTYAPFKPFYMYTKNINVRDNTIDPANVARVVLWLEGATAGKNVILESANAQGEGATGPVSFLPFVDKYGQYTHTDWPDKIYSDGDFVARLEKEKSEMSAYPGPTDWDKWGGWNGPKQKATGFFYPEKVDGKWWLVDPHGSLFWSYGPTGVGAGGEGSPVTGKEEWFTELPATDGPLGKYWGKGKGARYMYYADGKEWRSFDFGSANAERKYGADWREATTDFMHRRLRNWGFNTIANWSDSAVYLKHKTPYVVAIHYGGPWLEHIPDVFDPEFEKVIAERMEKERETTANDPWNIGYFVDNELAWSYMDGAEGVIRSALRAEATSGTKKALLNDLKAKYNDIAALNAAWGTEYASWEAMLQSRELPEPKNAKARGQDLATFGLKFVEKYFSTVRDAVKRVAPNNMYLGCRFHGHIDTAIVRIAAKYADVVSWNVYEEPGSRLNRFIDVLDKPFIVGEFGIESDPGQTPFRGDKLSVDPAQRVHSFENWVRKAAVHPLIVGGHYFQFRDQPISGRGDGEAVLRGFVNTADTPHFDLVQANRRLGYGLYAMRSTGRAPSQWSNQPIKGMIGVATWSTQAEFKDIKLTKEGKTLFVSEFAKGMQGWKTTDGQWAVKDGTLQQTGTAENPRAIIGDLAWSDYTLTLKARKLGGAEGFLIIFGSPGDDTTSWWNLGGWNNSQHRLEVPGIAQTQVAGRIETGRWYDIRIEVQGTTVKCYLDGKLTQQATR